MHRQSLGSPSSKLHIHGGPKEDILVVEETKRRNEEDDNNNDKAPKAHRLSSPPPYRPDKFIHLIPILTLVCFFILFLFSHTPSQSDLVQFTGFKHPAKHFNSGVEMKGIKQYMKVERGGDVLAIRSLRNLREITKSRPHRKFADF